MRCPAEGWEGTMVVVAKTLAHGRRSVHRPRSGRSRAPELRAAPRRPRVSLAPAGRPGAAEILPGICQGVIGTATRFLAIRRGRLRAFNAPSSAVQGGWTELVLN